MANDIFQNIDQIKKGTIEGKIFWEKKSETTFIWKAQKTANEETNVIVQKMKGLTYETVLLRVFDVKNRNTLMEVSSDTKDEKLSEKLNDLYRFVSDNYMYGNSILSNLLKDI